MADYTAYKDMPSGRDRICAVAFRAAGFISHAKRTLAKKPPVVGS
jgi:hypothetical protein